MTKEIVVKKDSLTSSLEERGMDKRQFRVIKEILYPNVQKDETLLMAIDYCKTRNFDIMKRTIQIVPIWDSKTKSMKDTIWPSIAEVRITATRTGQYAGRSEAEFGEEIIENLAGIEAIYPRWCKVTVYRIVKGEKCTFTAKLFWKQEYKTAKNDTAAPNAMWSKRSYSQLEKCTEAAALRMAFPEEIGNDYIAEEAFNANDEILNVTPKSKTAAAHVLLPENPPAEIEEAFNIPASKVETSNLTDEEKQSIVQQEMFGNEN
jgi:phage recombination protein Bet